MLKNILKVSLGAFFLSLLSACSTYKIAYDYKPPQTKQGLSCIQGSQTQLAQCKTRCAHQYQNCLRESAQQAKKNLPSLLQEYPKELEIWLNAREQYRRELDWYEFRMDMAEVRRDSYLERCEKSGKKHSTCNSNFNYRHNLAYSKPHFTLARPIKPTLASETARLRNVNCSQNCGCESNYRLSYASCGGVVTSKKVCIRNCN